jgi:ankyrin repeat protein
MKKLLIIIGVIVGLNTSIVAGPIHSAARSRDIDEIKSVLNIGVSVDHEDENGWTALMVSIFEDNFEIADYLISIGANVNAANNGGRTPMFFAYSDKMIKSLINNGANVNHQDNMGYTPLMDASSQVASILIENGAEINLKNRVGMTALHYATAELSRRVGGEVIQILLAHKVDINATNIYGKTPLDYAPMIDSRGEVVPMFETLRQAGAKTGYELLEEKVNQLSTATTNPTDEWPRKMWEIDLEEQKNNFVYYVGLNKSIVLNLNSDSYWVTQDGRSFKIKNTYIDDSDLHYLDNKNLIYRKRVNDVEKIILLSRNKELVSYNEAIPINIKLRKFDSHFNPPIGVSQFGTKVTAWDFTPPSSTAPKPDGGNNGGNETANSRLIIKTAGPDISLATDGKLGAAELQKSNDLRNWRKLGDVPAEASEVLLTPRESGNEFYRLKKK